jgi:phosphoglycerate dehydrogenase-like enzyme
MAAVLAYERGLLQNASQRKNLSWDQDSYVQAVTRKLSEIRIGVLGLGCIGENVAQSFVSFGCEVWAYDKDQTRGEELRGIKLCTDMNSLLSQSDYLIVAVSDNENKDLISGKEFMRMNKGICIVNVSRGSVVNEDAMIKAIAQGEIRGAILDVLNKEPISRFSKIRRLPNIVITPHIAGNIDLVYQDIARHFKGTIINRINV